MLDSQRRDDYLVQAASADRAIQQFAEILCRRTRFLNQDDDRITCKEDDRAAGTDSVHLDSISLDWLGRRVQEDIAVMQNDPSAGYPLIAGCVCFPSGWTVREKVGRSVLAMHHDVPEFESELYPNTERLMQRLKPERSVWRTNWGLRPSSQLDQSPRHSQFLESERREITASNVGRRCYFRVEFQTLTRVPCGDIVFLIRTEQCPLEQLTSQQKRILHGTLTTCPDSTLSYKGILPMRGSLLQYLSLF